MKHQNRNHVPISTGDGVVWTFIGPSNVDKIRDQARSMISLCNRLFESFEEFLTPIELTYPIHVYPPGSSRLTPDDTDDPAETIERNLSNYDGLTAADLVSSIQDETTNVHWIPRIPFDRNRLKVRFDAGTRWIDRTDCVQYHRGEPMPGERSWDPLEVTIAHIPNRGYEEIDSTYVFHIGVSIRSSIWIEPTESGEINKQHLSEFFGRVHDSVPIERVDRDVYRTSDFWVDLGIQGCADGFSAETIY